jgi:formate dehydrogenase alpha subunit
MSNSIQEILGNDVIFIIGSNTAENHPVIWYHMNRAKGKGAKLIVADPRKIEPAKKADIFLQLKPGTNTALLNGLAHVIVREHLYNKEFIDLNTESFEELKKTVEKYTPEHVAAITGIPADYIVAAARMYAAAKNAAIYYTMGITQHSTGVKNVLAISNLALLCGQIGRESTGVNPLRGQNNVQGACDMGALPNVLPGYQNLDLPEAREKFEKAWGVDLSKNRGYRATEITHAIENGGLKVLYVMGENIAVSDPDVKHVEKALEKLDFLVVQDIFLTETAQFADVVLPSSCFAEKDGTFTNTERRVQRVRRAVAGPGEVKADWEILQDVMNRLGHKKIYQSPADIMDEIAQVTPQYGGINYQRIEDTGIQWPCPDVNHPGTRFLHKDKIARGKGLFNPVDHQDAMELPDHEYPIILTTGRILYHYHTRTMTGRVEGLEEIASSSFVEINPISAQKLNITDGEIVRVTSRRGSLETIAKILDRVDENVVFIPFHFAQGNANILTNNVLDPVSLTPELKVAAVKIEKIEK